MEPLSLDSHDVVEVEEFLNAIYSRVRVERTGERAHARIRRRVMTATVAFDDLEYGCELRLDAGPQSQLVVCDVLTGAVRLEGVGAGTFGPGDIFLICRPDLPFTAAVRSARLRQIALDPALLAQALPDSSAVAEPPRFSAHRPISLQAAINLRRSIAYLRNKMIISASTANAQLVTAAAGRYLAACVLDTFPNTAVALPAVADVPDTKPGTLRRALSFIDANPDVSLTVVDIARATQVTPRALQLAFRRHLQVTPMEYVRRVRMDCAHHDLSVASPGDGTTVTDVAYRWGFSNPGRFAQQHRDEYGVTPSELLVS